MRVRGILAAAITLCLLALPGAAGADLIPLKVLLAYTPGWSPGQELITIHLTGRAAEVYDTYTPGGQLESHELAELNFAGSCSEIVDTARVRASYNAICQPTTSQVSGWDSYTRWGPVTHQAQTCYGTAYLRPHAHWWIGGTLETGTVMNAQSDAPLIDDFASPSGNQLIVKSNNPAVGCTALRLDTPHDMGREFGRYRINKLMPFPGHASNDWTATLGTGALDTGSATFHVDLDVDVERHGADRPLPKGAVDTMKDFLKWWWNAQTNPTTVVPGVIKLQLTNGQLDVQWSAEGTVTHYTYAPRLPAASRSQSGGSNVLFTINQPLHIGLNTVMPQLTPLGRELMTGRATASALTATVTYRPPHGAPITIRQTYKPDSPPASITSVQFTGDPAHPTIIIRGRGLAPLPHQNPVGSPTGHNGCPAVSGPTGSDYGLQLQINNPAKNWGAGFSTATNTSCIGLIPKKVTPNELDLELGSFYTTYYPKFALAPGDLVQIVAKGAGITVHVAYGAPVSK